jgi:hypothetical protein
MNADVSVISDFNVGNRESMPLFHSIPNARPSNIRCWYKHTYPFNANFDFLQ